MKLFGNIEQRAEQAFKQIIEDIGLTRQNERFRASSQMNGLTIQARYQESKGFFSRIFKLEISLIFNQESAPVGSAYWNGGKRWKGDNEIQAWLESHPDLSNLMSNIELENCFYSRPDTVSEAVLSVVALPGCFIWTLIPPMHYFVRLDDKEADLLRALPSTALAH
ncbi:hypothetical protein MBH78_00585 [Oceanimonas sp. NS1]|nr:hypothetical protein [Oceanimonas sp. NS1]